MDFHRLICTDIRRIEIEPFNLGPVPHDGFLVKNEYTAVSIGTEIYQWTHGSEPSRNANFPHPTGYCNVGTVLEIGNNISHLKPGDRICSEGNHASHAIFSNSKGFHQKVPKNVSSKAAAFMIMGAIALHGVRVAGIQLGESVLVLGMGIVGQLSATLSALAGGIPIIALDLNDFRLNKAKKRDVEFCFNPEKIDDLPSTIRQHTPENGANVVLEATGIPAVYPTAVKLACDAGRVIALGSPRGTVEMDFLADVHLREVSILGAIQPRTPNNDHIYHRWSKHRERNLIMRLMDKDKLPVEDLITHVARPEQCQEIYAMLSSNPKEALGVLFKWD